MKTWSGSDVDIRGRRWQWFMGWVSCIVRPWFWPEWRRIWKNNVR